MKQSDGAHHFAENKLSSVALLQVAVTLLLAFLVGCGSCSWSDNEQLSKEELEKRRKEQRESLQLGELLSLPVDTTSKFFTAKPGHWHETKQVFKSNREDLQVVVAGSVRRGSKQLEIPGTNINVDFARRTSLPKGQTKVVDLQFFIPYTGIQEDPYSTQQNRLGLRTDVFALPLMAPIMQVPDLKVGRELEPHVYQMMVLSPQANSYLHLNALDAVNWKMEDTLLSDERTRSYYVSAVKPENNRYAIPSSMLTMTAIAAIIWDDVAVDDLSIDQRNAIIDWVHWGGQLIISGPNSWSRLQNSFLSPYLPNASVSPSELGEEAFAELSDNWAVTDLAEPNRSFPIQIPGSYLAGIDMQLNERGSWIPGTGQLAAETQVGRGRIVVTAFPMRDPRIFNWRYYSSFLSTGLLRRPPRTIEKLDGRGNPTLIQKWDGPLKESNRDPRLHSNFRILSRDLALSSNNATAVADTAHVDRGEADLGDGANEDAKRLAAATASELNLPDPNTPGDLEQMRWSRSGAAWNDESGFAYAAIESLRAAAGIELPSRKTIIYLLTGYLICLVPLNWLFFRLFNRLEFAWVVAPILAVAGVVVVTQVARLDIGFARRNTEISLLELHEGHQRGHLTRYLAMYTSLSTNYTVEFPENGAVALPLGTAGRNQLRAESASRSVRTNYGRSEGVSLEPLTVYSNSTEMLHAEQMLDLGGSLLLGSTTEDGSDFAIKNTTGLDLKATLIVRRSTNGQVEVAWVGELNNEDKAILNYRPFRSNAAVEEWNANPATRFVNLSNRQQLPNNEDESASDSDATSELWVGNILKQLLRKTPLMPGQTRLIAYTDSRPGDLTITPKEDQFDGRCVIVAHLTPMELPSSIRPDTKIISRFNNAALLNEADVEEAN